MRRRNAAVDSLCPGRYSTCLNSEPVSDIADKSDVNLLQIIVSADTGIQFYFQLMLELF